MKNLKINMEYIKNKKKLNVMRVLVCGTIALNTFLLSGCGSSNNSEEISVREYVPSDNSLDETWEYFENVVEPVEFNHIYINCDEFPTEIRHEINEIPSIFYDKLNTLIKTGANKHLIIWCDDNNILDYSKITSNNVIDVNYVYREKKAGYYIK